MVCSLDYRAKIVIESARRLGLRVPEDVSVTGFSNTPWSESYRITTVDLHADEIAAGILRLLDQFSEDIGNHTSHRILVEPELVVRETTGEKKEC